MSTFINLGLVSLNKRLAEVDIILQEARQHSDDNADLYNSLCRSAQVLLCAHFEGYVKDLVKNALEDINLYSDFRSSRSALKRRHCAYFVRVNAEEKDSKEHNKRVLELISEFEGLNAKFKKEIFSYSDNQNPKTSVLDKIAEQFGVKNFFKQLKKSNLDLVFSNTHTENLQLCQEIETLMLQRTSVYPYQTDLGYLEIDSEKSDSDNLWDVFISDFLKRRHGIAHGAELESTVGHSTIENDKTKIKVLLYAFTSFICIESNPANYTAVL
ncbi:hypothetical protein KK062_21100 [Fulvivirgaceae bacterium PWU5]|uniref:RiboL-PSP-HEPN domain-containing protein n=1 Tax=Dawidia cretensis TaxID=2782350 RepID=A0AAP2E368_9BACT|nr:MAE_28990/MAE_18760 family HEPN-like nuclease [Dawidia cretensis]MBT1710752.1 hypothetical protein [Dawidia cretensis]